MSAERLERDPTALAPFATDFGRLVRGQPRAFARPTSAGAVVELLRQARAEGLTVTPRGQGLSQGGQSISEGGLSLDLSALDQVEEPDVEGLTIRCQGGARWRALVERCLPHGLLPRVLPLNLDLTVGGVLSVGGIGASSHLAGPAVSTVRALEVVTGVGELVRTHGVATSGNGAGGGEPDLAGVVLAGLGRCGVITGAQIELRRCAPQVRTFYLLYDSLEGWLGDQQRLLASPRPPHWMESFTTVAAQGLRNGPQGRRPFGLWFYGLHLSWEYGADGQERPEAERALAGLSPYRLVHVEDGETAAFQDRYQPRFQAMRALGAWEQPHPWVEAFLPVAAARDILPELLAELPMTLGDGHRLMFVAADRLPFALAVPEGEGARPLVAFAILPPGLPPPLREPHLAALRAAHDRLVKAGGKRYLSGWLPAMKEDPQRAWADHFGPRYPAWQAARRRFDPQGIFQSALFGGGPGGEVTAWSSR